MAPRSVSIEGLRDPMKFSFLFQQMGALSRILGAPACIAILLWSAASSASRVCELTAVQSNHVYRFSLASQIKSYPHGVLSEDGFYKVAANDTWLWFQLCSQMIFNHDQPRCFRCEGCGGSLYCGNKCSALVSINNAGYRVCTSIGQASKSHITLIDERRPKTGVVIKMSSVTEKMNCSLSVSVFCDQSATVPTSVDHVGGCDYATTMRHPAACADVISGGRSGLGWFGTFITALICLLGAYLLAGTVYRFLFLGVRGVEAYCREDVDTPRDCINLTNNIYNSGCTTGDLFHIMQVRIPMQHISETLGRRMRARVCVCATKAWSHIIHEMKFGFRAKLRRCFSKVFMPMSPYQHGIAGIWTHLGYSKLEFLAETTTASSDSCVFFGEKIFWTSTSWKRFLFPD